MLMLVNRERAWQGIGPLMVDPALRTVARAHSVDMFERGYFSHYTPEGTDPLNGCGRRILLSWLQGKSGACADLIDRTYGANALAGASRQHTKSRLSSGGYRNYRRRRAWVDDLPGIQELKFSFRKGLGAKECFIYFVIQSTLNYGKSR